MLQCSWRNDSSCFSVQSNHATPEVVYSKINKSITFCFPVFPEECGFVSRAPGVSALPCIPTRCQCFGKQEDNCLNAAQQRGAVWWHAFNFPRERRLCLQFNSSMYKKLKEIEKCGFGALKMRKENLRIVSSVAVWFWSTLDVLENVTFQFCSPEDFAVMAEHPEHSQWQILIGRMDGCHSISLYCTQLVLYVFLFNGSEGF